jgi:hypothetical protein
MIIFTLIVTAHVTAEETPPPQQPQSLGANIPPRPVAFVPETQFQFSPVLDGTQISHDFIILNTGGGPLQIRDVITNCGCATAEFPREIPPGGQGKITIKGDTTGYGGTSFDRDILVSTNDPQKSVFHIYYYGKVEEFAYIEPKVLVLRGAAGQPIQSTVTITPRKEYPFTLIHVDIDDSLKDKVKFSKDQKDGKYLITVDNIKESPGKYLGKLFMKTDSPLKPEMKMYIKGFIN